MFACVSVRVGEPLVVAEVEVGLGAVVGDEDLAVLERAHRAGIDVQVRVELLQSDAQPAAFEQAADAGRRDPFPERGNHAARHKDAFRHFVIRGNVRWTLQIFAIPVPGPLAYPRRGTRTPFPPPVSGYPFSSARNCSRRSACSSGPTGKSGIAEQEIPPVDVQADMFEMHRRPPLGLVAHVRDGRAREVDRVAATGR